MKICKHYEAPHAENWPQNQPKTVKKLIMLPSYGNTSYKQTEKPKQASSTFLLKTREKSCKLIALDGLPLDKNFLVAESKKLSK